MKVSTVFPPVLVGGVLVGALFGGSCARAPSVPSPTTSASGTGSIGSKYLYVTMTVRGRINTTPPDATTTGNAYFVLINRSDDINEGGAVPIVGTPWSNGYAAPARNGGQGFVGLVRYDNRQTRSSTNYGVYSTTAADGTTLVNPLTLGAYDGYYQGPPDVVVAPQNGQNSGQTLTPGDQNTLYFRLNLDKLPNADKRYLFINLIATNNLPQGDRDAPKLWDALGDGTSTGSINNSIILDVTQNPTLTNPNQGQISHEPSNDVRDHASPALAVVDAPDIDIIDYTVRVAAQ